MTSGRDGGVPRSTGAVDSPESFAGWVLPWPRFEVDWRRAALLVIDVQNYSSKVGMGIAQMLAERHPEVAGYYADRIENTMVPNIRRLIDGFRLAGREIIYTRHGPLLPDGRDMIARRRVRDEEAIHATHKPALWPAGSFEHEIIDALRPEIGDLVLEVEPGRRKRVAAPVLPVGPAAVGVANGARRATAAGKKLVVGPWEPVHMTVDDVHVHSPLRGGGSTRGTPSHLPNGHSDRVPTASTS